MVHINSIEEFHSLLNYYISCLEKEDRLSLTFNFKSDGKRFHSNIFRKEQLFLHKKEQIEVKKTPEIENIFKDYKLLQRDMPVFYGYPLFMDSDGNVSPVFFVEIFFEEKDDSFIFTKESVVPEFNHHILTKHDYNVEEINKIRLEIEEENDVTIKLEKITKLLHFENKTISSELEQTPLILRPSLQLINKAILYFGGRTGFTKGLIHELQELKKKSQHQLESTSLEVLFDNKEKETSKKQKDLLEIFNLNESQENAIENAFSNNISVITGPPGTGKSQVVLNIIANAVWNDKTVLFASKNNRAVDVVNDKLKTILSKDLIVRMGSGERRKKAKLQMDKLFQDRNSLKSSEVENDLHKIKILNKEVSNLKGILMDISKTNEEIEEIQNQTDNLAKEIPEKLYNQCKNDEFKVIDKFKLEKDISDNFDNINLIKRLIKIILPSFYFKREHAIFQEYYSLLSIPFKEYLDKNTKLSTGDIKKSLSWILLFKQEELLWREIDTLKQKLIKSDSIYSIHSKIDRFQKERIKYSRTIFESYWFEKLKKTSPRDENHISRYIDASEKLEKYIEDYSLWKQLGIEQENEVQEILSFFPIWVVTNLSAKNSLPLKENLFDLLIIDEASQCDIASALPLFYRAKQVVIIGDPKQLKHISLLRGTEDKKIASENKIAELYLDYAYSKNSLYDVAERTIKSNNKSPLLLNQHYRSHKDIISFSNEHFYDNKLNIMTDESKLISNNLHTSGIIWRDICGKTSQAKSPSNEDEAIEIIKLFKSFKKKFGSNKISFGVVTLFRNHMELIVDMIKNSEELKDMDITVGTAHRFQGDEKDIIIFSPAISTGIKQQTLNWIHTTTQLLNVAITRAKSVLIIVGDKKKCYDAGGFLKKLVEHVEAKKEIAINFDSPIEEELFKRLAEEGIKVLPQYETKIKERKPYRLDFALFINNNKYDIEIDGDKAHSQKIESDILRDIHLRMEGWKIRRFQASEINNNLKGVIEEIKRFY